MEELNNKAQVVGGAVLSLIGNHEVMNLIGDFRYASEFDIKEVGGLEVRKKLWSMYRSTRHCIAAEECTDV